MSLPFKVLSALAKSPSPLSTGDLVFAVGSHHTSLRFRNLVLFTMESDCNIVESNHKWSLTPQGAALHRQMREDGLGKIPVAPTKTNYTGVGNAHFRKGAQDFLDVPSRGF